MLLLNVHGKVFIYDIILNLEKHILEPKLSPVRQGWSN